MSSTTITKINVGRGRFFYGDKVADFKQQGVEPLDMVSIVLNRKTDMGPDGKFLCTEAPARELFANDQHRAFSGASLELLMIFSVIAEYPVLGFQPVVTKFPGKSNTCSIVYTEGSPVRVDTVSVFQEYIRENGHYGPIVSIIYHFARYTPAFTWQFAIMNYLHLGRTLRPRAVANGVGGRTQSPQPGSECMTGDLKYYFKRSHAVDLFENVVRLYMGGVNEEITSIGRDWSEGLAEMVVPPKKRGEDCSPYWELDGNESSDLTLLFDRKTCDKLVIGLGEGRSIGCMPSPGCLTRGEPNLCTPFHLYYMNHCPSPNEVAWAKNASKHVIMGNLTQRSFGFETEETGVGYDRMRREFEVHTNGLSVEETEKYRICDDRLDEFEHEFNRDPSLFRISAAKWISEQEQQATPEQPFTLHMNKVPKICSNLSPFGQRIVYIMKRLENSCDVNTAHVEIFESFIRLIQVGSQGKFEPAHFLAIGGASSSKSMMMEIFNSLMIPGVVEETDNQTDRVNNVTRQKNNTISTIDEAYTSIMHKEFTTPGLKSALSKGIMHTERNNVTEDGRHYNTRETAHVKQYLYTASNEPSSDMDHALKSRIQIRHIQAFAERKCRGINHEELREMSLRALESDLRKCSVLAYAINAMIAARLLPQIDERAAEKAFEPVLEELKNHGYGFQDILMRVKRKCTGFARALCIFNAAMEVFATEEPGQPPTPFNIRTLFDVKPHLIVTEEMSICAFTSARDDYTHGVAEDVSKLVKGLGKQFESPKTTSSTTENQERDKEDVALDKYYYAIPVRVDYNTNTQFRSASNTLATLPGARFSLASYISFFHDTANDSFKVAGKQLSLYRALPNSNSLGILKKYVNYHVEGMKNLLKCIQNSAFDRYDIPHQDYITLIPYRDTYESDLPYLLNVVQTVNNPGRVTRVKDPNFIGDDGELIDYMVGEKVFNTKYHPVPPSQLEEDFERGIRNKGEPGLITTQKNFSVLVREEFDAKYNIVREEEEHSEAEAGAGIYPFCMIPASSKEVDLFESQQALDEYSPEEEEEEEDEERGKKRMRAIEEDGENIQGNSISTFNMTSAAAAAAIDDYDPLSGYGR